MRVLFLTHRLPYAPNRGDRIRAYHIVRRLASRVDLEIASLVHSEEELGKVDAMCQQGLAVEARLAPRLTNYVKALPTLIGSRPLTHALLDAPGFGSLLTDIVRRRPPDVVLAYCSGMARFAMEPPLDRFPLVIDFVDVDSAKWADLAARSSWPKQWVFRRESACLSAFERISSQRAASTVVVNEREAAILRTLAPGTPVHVIPNGIDLDAFRPLRPPANNPVVVFCGVMNYEPNVEGVLWFAREAWPQIVGTRPETRLVIVGSDPTPAIRDLAISARGIEVTGTVPRVQDHLWNAAVAIAPLRMARGIQNKVLEALAAGLPAVVTTTVADGLPGEALEGCRVADSPDAFAAATLALLAESPLARREIASRAPLSSLSWGRQLEPFHEILTAAHTTRI